MSSALDLVRAENLLGNNLTARGRANLRALLPQAQTKAAIITLSWQKAATRQGADRRHRAEVSALIRDLNAAIANTEHPDQLKSLKAELEQAKGSLRAIDQAERESAKVTPEEKRLRRRVFAGEKFSLIGFINSKWASAPHEFAPASYKLNKGQTRQELLTSTRDATEAEEQKARDAKASQLTLEERLAKMHSEVAEMVRRGAPDTAPLGRMRLVDETRLTFAQGGIGWPTTSHHIVGGDVVKHFDTDAGNPFLVWAFRDQIVERLTRQIEAECKATHCMSQAERDAAIRQSEAKILELQRLEERLISDIAEHEGIEIERLPGRHALALLEIAPV